MNVNPMEEQVGRIIGNLLAAGETVFLPGVGILGPERRAARQIPRGGVEPPCCTIVFSSQEEQGVSLVAEIARILSADGCPAEEAEATARTVYERWSERACRDGMWVIEGVGTLKENTFSVDEAFDRRLNPQGHMPVKIRRTRPDWVIWVGVAAVVAAAGIGATSLLTNSDRHPEDTGISASESVVADSSPSDDADDWEDEELLDDEFESDEEVGAQSPAASAATASGKAVAGDVGNPPAANPAAAQSYEPASMISKHTYVVLGVFSTKENAARAAKSAVAKAEGISLTCGVYRFGAKFMVSPFESNDAEACRLFVRAHRDRFADMWIYTAR